MELMGCLEAGMSLGVPVTTNHEIRQEVCTRDWVSSMPIP